MTIISAFYDLEWCDQFVTATAVKHVRLVVNGLGGRRLAEQNRDLCDLKRKAARKRITLDVRLAFAPGIFHSKLILIEHARRPLAFIGSANATSAAMQKNEEIMLLVSGDLSDLIGYADRICDEHSIDAAEETPEAVPASLITFFRTGSLYFKSVTTLQLTLNPFKEIERSLPQKVKTRLGSVSLPHAEGQTGVGAFSLIRALKLGADERGVPAKIKPFVVETSLGYWVPDALSDELSAVLEKATRTKRRIWRARRQTILATPLAKAKKFYGQYINAVRSLLEENGSKSKGKDGRDPLAVDRFDTFYRSVTTRLHNEQFFERLIEPFSPTGVPEMWDDPIARRDFEDTFFEYLEYIGTLSSKPRVPRTILNELDEPAATSEEIRNALEVRLREGWEPRVWAKK